jgi:hypothetical protein
LESLEPVSTDDIKLVYRLQFKLVSVRDINDKVYL